MQTEGYILDIQRFPLGSPLFRRQVEDFLAANGLRLEPVDDYFCITGEDGAIVAGAGLSRDIIKCVAVDSSVRSQGLLAPLVSHIIGYAGTKGISNLKVFTKPENEAVFSSLGFHLLASAPKAILMENGRGLEEYLDSFIGVGKSQDSGVIIMNANPFTLGHKYLVEKASEQVDRLFVIPVREDVSMFPYEERLEMVRKGCEGFAVVLEGSDYQISAATFPTYFLKDLSDASETQMLLDLDLFGRRIAPALGVTVRFVGSEPSDPLTARYNELMKEVLPSYGISVVEIPRLMVIQASDVRKALEQGRFHDAATLTPPSTWPYLVAELMSRALRMELDAPLKPGLVDPDSNGAHSDMDYTLMKGSIDVIRRSFVRHMPGTFDSASLVSFGKAVEADVLEYTGGVNTYRGAIFALGLAAVAAIDSYRDLYINDNESVNHIPSVDYDGRIMHNCLNNNDFQNTVSKLADGIDPSDGSHGAMAVKEYGAKGALQMAREGYKPLFEDWLPYYRSMDTAAGSWGLQKTLLRIMTTLDDTCVLHRVGYERAQQVKAEAETLLEHFTPEGLVELKVKYDREGISPGGAADMLALTILIDSLINNDIAK